MNEIEVEYFPVWRRYLPLVRNAGLAKLELADLFIAMMEYQFEGKDPEGDVKVCRVHVIQQVHQNLFCSTGTQIMDEEQDLFHPNTSPSNKDFKYSRSVIFQ